MSSDLAALVSFQIESLILSHVNASVLTLVIDVGGGGT